MDEPPYEYSENFHSYFKMKLNTVKKSNNINDLDGRTNVVQFPYKWRDGHVDRNSIPMICPSFSDIL